MNGDSGCYWPGCEEQATAFLPRSEHWSEIVREKVPHRVCAPHAAELEHRDGWEPGYVPSNGTEGDYFRWDTCNVCKFDHAWHGPEEGTETCPILLHSLTCYPNPGPAEWEENYRTGDKRCTKFEPCECAS